MKKILIREAILTLIWVLFFSALLIIVLIAAERVETEATDEVMAIIKATEPTLSISEVEQSEQIQPEMQPGKFYTTHQPIINYPSLTLETGLTTISTFTFRAGEGSIVVSSKDGSVKFENITLDDSGKAFWNSVSKAFPDFANAVILGYQAKDQQTKILSIEWVDHPYAINGKIGRTGVRSDGVMVWKETK